MKTLSSPIEKTVTLIGFTVLSITDSPGNYVSAVIRKHYSNGHAREDTVTLWAGADNLSEEQTIPADEEGGEPTVVPAVPNAFSYNAAGQWTDEDAAARIEQILSE